MPKKFYLFLLPFVLCGFALSQPVYQLLLQSPEFLLARQNSNSDVWALVAVLSFAIPMVLALPGWLSRNRWPVFAAHWCWAICAVFAALFFAQLLQTALGDQWFLFVAIAIVFGLAAAWVLLFSRWSSMTSILAIPALIFPLWFLVSSPSLQQVDGFSDTPLERLNPEPPSADIIFVVLDELPMATLLGKDDQVDQELFPGFARLQSISDWYYNTTTVSDGTLDAVPSILTGLYPDETSRYLTFTEQPNNLFTYLRHHYQYNVAESVSRLCPQALCPRAGPGSFIRIKALLLDLAVVYLHRVAPSRWSAGLPEVTSNWSGFFAERQMFFPQQWSENAGQQVEIDRPGFFQTIYQFHSVT